MEKQLISSHRGTINLQLGNDSMIAMKLSSFSTKLSKELANQLAMFILLNSATLISLETSTHIGRSLSLVYRLFSFTYSPLKSRGEISLRGQDCNTPIFAGVAKANLAMAPPNDVRVPRVPRCRRCRHDDAVQRRPTAPRLLPRPFPPLWPVQQTCSTPSPLLSLSPEPSRVFPCANKLALRPWRRRPRPPCRAPTSTLPRLQSTSETVSSRSSGAPRPGRPSISSPTSRRRGQSRRRPSAPAEGPPPAFPKPNRPCNDLLQGTVELSDLLPTAHGRRSTTVAARVRRRPLCSVEPPPPSASAIPKTLQR